MGSLPTRTVTFLFNDIEGSTALVQRLGVPLLNLEVEGAASRAQRLRGRLPENAAADAVGDQIDWSAMRVG